MKRTVLLTHCWMMCAVQALGASTFEKTPLAPEIGVDVLTRRVAREQVGRDLFANPYATVTIANVDIYDRFPYVESRQFQVVSDTRWNRLVYGERGGSLRAFDGRGGLLGALSEPRGMAVDEHNRVYVADAGNNRVVVLQAATDQGRIELVPRYAIDGLANPYDVAYSDGGTPFSAGDDVLYVADTGKSRVAAFALSEDGARRIATLGDLGSGVGRFAGPLAIAAGRADGVHTRDVYVADAHNRRIVHLRHEANGLQWVGEVAHETDLLTSLATDQWGNVYAAAPQRGVVRKFSPGLVRVADLQGLSRPRSFHVPFVTVTDHRDGRRMRVGQPNAVSIDQWSDQSGVELWKLGLELSDLGVEGGDAPVAHFTLTDRADVAIEVADAGSGRALARRSVGTLAAGVHTVALEPRDMRGASGGHDLLLRVTAASSYANGPSDAAQARFRTGNGGAAVLPARPILLGNTPNPMTVSTRIAFVLPAAGLEGVTLRLFDASGRRLRTFDRAYSPGLNEVVWDGTDDRGRALNAGVYYYRLELAGQRWTRSIVLVR